jgi:hypothetical protein
MNPVVGNVTGDHGVEVWNVDGFRFLIVGETPGLAFAEIGCLAVGFTF